MYTYVGCVYLKTCSTSKFEICREDQQTRNSRKNWSLRSGICRLESQTGLLYINIVEELLLFQETSVCTSEAFIPLDEDHPFRMWSPLFRVYQLEAHVSNPATQEAEFRRIMFWIQSGQKFSKIPFQSIRQAWRHVPVIPDMVPISGGLQYETGPRQKY
jgi:hypothetical protein